MVCAASKTARTDLKQVDFHSVCCALGHVMLATKEET